MSTTTRVRPAAVILTPAAEARIAELMQKAPEGVIEQMLHDANAMAQKIREHRFKKAKPRSKVLILDANADVTSKGPLFKKFWAENYAGMLEYRGSYKAIAVDARTRTIKFDVQNDVKADVLNVLPAMRAGAIAVSTGQRIGATPDIPTMAESGVPGIDVDVWWSMQGPAGMPAPVARQREATLAGQHPVQQDGIGQDFVDLASGCLAIGHPDRLKAVVAQINGDQLGDGRLVFNHQDSGELSHRHISERLIQSGPAASTGT